MKPKIVNIGDYVQLRGETGWWRVDAKRRGWLRLAQERNSEEDLISALASTVTRVAHFRPLSDGGKG